MSIPDGPLSLGRFMFHEDENPLRVPCLCPDRCLRPFGVYRVNVILIQVGWLDVGEWEFFPRES